MDQGQQGRTLDEQDPLGSTLDEQNPLGSTLDEQDPLGSNCLEEGSTKGWEAAGNFLVIQFRRRSSEAGRKLSSSSCWSFSCWRFWDDGSSSSDELPESLRLLRGGVSLPWRDEWSEERWGESKDRHLDGPGTAGSNSGRAGPTWVDSGRAGPTWVNVGLASAGRLHIVCRNIVWSSSNPLRSWRNPRLWRRGWGGGTLPL